MFRELWEASAVSGYVSGGLAKDDQGDEAKDQKLIDAARVNLGIAQANTNIETYKALVLNDLHGLLDWKIKR